MAANVRRQIDTADKLTSLGYIPCWPLASHFWHLVYPHDHEFWMQQDFEWVARCDVLLRLDGESSGADREVGMAAKYNIPVYFSIESLVENLPPDVDVRKGEM